MSKSSFYGLFFLVLLLSIAFVSASNAQTTNHATKVLVKTFAADTLDISGLQANGNEVDVDVTFNDNVTNIRIVQSIEVVNSNNQNVVNKLVSVGYFDYKMFGSSNNLVLSDKSDHAITVGDNQLEIRRKYQVVVPSDKVVKQ